MDSIYGRIVQRGFIDLDALVHETREMPVLEGTDAAKYYCDSGRIKSDLRRDGTLVTRILVPLNMLVDEDLRMRNFWFADYIEWPETMPNGDRHMDLVLHSNNGSERTLSVSLPATVPCIERSAFYMFSKAQMCGPGMWPKPLHGPKGMVVCGIFGKKLFSAFYGEFTGEMATYTDPCLFVRKTIKEAVRGPDKSILVPEVVEYHPRVEHVKVFTPDRLTVASTHLFSAAMAHGEILTSAVGACIFGLPLDAFEGAIRCVIALVNTRKSASFERGEAFLFSQNFANIPQAVVAKLVSDFGLSDDFALENSPSYRYARCKVFSPEMLALLTANIRPMVNIAVFGSRGVGKTSFIRRACGGTFNGTWVPQSHVLLSTTTPISVKWFEYSVDTQATFARPAKLPKNIYVIGIYDTTKQDSTLHQLTTALTQVGLAHTLLIGLKSDMCMAVARGCSFDRLEASTKSNVNIQLAMEHVLSKALAKPVLLP